MAALLEWVYPFQCRRKQHKKAHRESLLNGLYGAPYWIRTSGLTLRRRALYPAELMAQKVFDFRGATGGIVTESIHSNAAGASLILEKYAFRLGAKLLICKSLYAGLF